MLQTTEIILEGKTTPKSASDGQCSGKEEVPQRSQVLQPSLMQVSSFILYLPGSLLNQGKKGSQGILMHCCSPTTIPSCLYAVTCSLRPCLWPRLRTCTWLTTPCQPTCLLSSQFSASCLRPRSVTFCLDLMHAACTPQNVCMFMSHACLAWKARLLECNA